MIVAETEGNERLSYGNSSRTDQDLIAAVNRGDAEAFEELYFRYRDWAARLACRYTHDEDLALDVMQEVFIYFMKKFPGFELCCELKTFLIRPSAISRSACAANRTAMSRMKKF
jgi:hypothetical protein